MEEFEGEKESHGDAKETSATDFLEEKTKNEIQMEKEYGLIVNLEDLSEQKRVIEGFMRYLEGCLILVDFIRFLAKRKARC